MAIKTSSQLSFGDISASLRKCKHTFFNQINNLINWSSVEKELCIYYPKGLRLSGKPAYSPLLLFKMLLLEQWYGLSDYQVEEEVNDRITFSRFCGISMDNSVPDHSVLSRFRTALTEKKALDRLLTIINNQLSSHVVLVQHGAVIDASITPTSRGPKGKKSYNLHEDGTISVSHSYQKGVDQEASWTKKGHDLYYGYKRHVLVESKEGLVLAVSTTKASNHDGAHLPILLDKVSLKAGSRLYGDKGYSGLPNETLLKKKSLKSAIQKKATKNHPLSPTAKRFNKLVSKTRYKVERVFGNIKRWFRSAGARYIGLEKTHTQHVMEAIAYNLYRAPNIILKGF
ncbi:IS5-like element ISCca3 family transposase [Cardinium endosymbiont of Bemisia tabaci]|uniref:IS5-like element ISCca3 family transposase n=1 Tax=Cardinium endosymbiont of Bemisia tabaci TaxID=672794 RepID=UPI000442D0B8|nr:IS5-like element ISCca3 family transposase [Cardinium endosymbiont of Bemisia tabaci]CDG49880.1 Transposase ISCca3, IS5 ssgr IS5 family [Cardinium endosymbiont cBtQ1 of Bemisia tabaci]